MWEFWGRPIVPLAEYEKPKPRWDVLLDLDALDKKEGKRWVFKGVECALDHCHRTRQDLNSDPNQKSRG